MENACVTITRILGNRVQEIKQEPVYTFTGKLVCYRVSVDGGPWFNTTNPFVKLDWMDYGKTKC